MIRQIKRVIRDIDRALNPPTYIGATKKKVERDLGDSKLRQRLEMSHDVRLWVIVGWFIIWTVTSTVLIYVDSIGVNK